MRKFYKYLEKPIVLTVLFTFLFMTCGTFFAGIDTALAFGEISVSTQGLPNGTYYDHPLKVSSSPTAIAKLQIYPTSTTYLATTTIYLSGNNFSTSTLLELSTGTSSGVILYKDSGSVPGSFDSDDVAVNTFSAPQWEYISSSTYKVDFTNFIPTQSLPGSATTTYFVVIKTSSFATEGAQIKATIPANGIKLLSGQTGPSIQFVTNPYLIDSTQPGISAVKYYSNNAVDVIFNEKMQTSTFVTSNFLIDGSTVPDNVYVVNDSTAKVVTHDPVIAGVTTITVNSNVRDLAGLSNASTSPTAVTAQAPKILISQFSSDYYNHTEFIELYNATSTAIDVTGWRIQYSDATSINWVDIYSFQSYSIQANKYYLIAGDGFGVVSSVVKDDSFSTTTPIFSDTGGHVRLVTADNQEVDRLGWGNAIAPEGSAASAPATGKSLERKAYGNSLSTDLLQGGMHENSGNSWDSHNNSADFVIQDYSYNYGPQNSSSAAEYPTFSSSENIVLGINHSPINFAETNNDLAVFAQMGDPSVSADQLTAELHYMVGNNTPSENTPASYTTAYGVHQGNGYFKFIVPQLTINNSTSYGMYYYLKLISSGGTKFLSGSPAADIEGAETTVAQNPFMTYCGTPNTKYSLSGYADLTDEADDSGVIVLAEGTGVFATTSSNGFWTMNIKPGTYNLVFIKSGYYEEWTNNLNLITSSMLGTKSLYPGISGALSGDSFKPTVKWVGPYDGASGLPYNDSTFKIKVSFSKDLDISTFSTSTIFLSTDGNTPLNGISVYYNPVRDAFMPSTTTDPYLGLIYVPNGGLASGTKYYVVITSGLRDYSGNSVSGNRTEGGNITSFTTQYNTSTYDYGSGAMQPPNVIDIKPVPGSIGVKINTKILVSFSDSMDYSSISTVGNIKLYRSTIVDNNESLTSVDLTSVKLDNSGKIAIIAPSVNLTANSKYKLAVTGAVKSVSGIYMGNPDYGQNVSTYNANISYFETGSVSDTVPPYIIGSWPQNNASGVPVNPGTLFVQFNETIDPDYISSYSVLFKKGSTVISSDIKYDPKGNSIFITPLVALSPDVNYTITVTGSSTGIHDISGNAMSLDHIINFTSSSTSDTLYPKLIYANANEYKMAVTFSEPMNSATISDTYNWSASVLNPANYIARWGDTATASTSGTLIDFTNTGTSLTYDNYTNTVFFENLGLSPDSAIGKDIFIDMSHGNAADLAGNPIASSTSYTAQFPINSSTSTTLTLGSGTTGTTYDASTMGIMRAGAFPKNAMAGQSTTYFIDLPLFKSIPAGGKILLSFPQGFDVTNARKDQYSGVNNDINSSNAGIIAFSAEAESPITGGADNDGVTVDAAARTITIKTSGSATLPNDYLHFDISGIINSLLPKGYDTSGYTVDAKTMDSNNVILESITCMPFYINPSGTNTLTINIAGIQDADVDGVNDNMYVYLGSPITGPLFNNISVAGNGSASAVFNNLPSGQYMVYTDPSLYFDGGSAYSGVYNPQAIELSTSTLKILTLTKETSAGKATIPVKVTGVFGTDDIDIYASGPSGFKYKTIADVGTVSASTLASFYLPDGTWMVGLTPSYPKGPVSGVMTPPDWISPSPVEVRVSNGGLTIVETSGTANDGVIDFSINSTVKQIIGYVKDGSNNPIADTEVWAYQPSNPNTPGAHARTDTDGKFILKLVSAGNYKVGAYKPGLPAVPEKSVNVIDNTGAVDNNSSADVYKDTGSLITDANRFELIIKKPAHTISGLVTDGTNQVSYASVWADRVDGYGHASAMSDASGNYIIFVDDGVWNLKAFMPGKGYTETKQIVVSGADIIQNLAPDSALSYYNISGKVGIDTDGDYSTLETPFSNLPIRAIKIGTNGAYLSNEYQGTTDAAGNYSFYVPGGAYRVDIWTPEYGELGINNLNGNNITNELADDAYASNPANVNVESTSTLTADIIINNSTLRNISLHFTNATSSETGYLKMEGVVSSANQTPNGFIKTTRLDDLTGTSTVKLQDGTYLFWLNVPGLGSYVPDDSSNPNGRNADGFIAVTNDRQVDFTLPDVSTSTNMVTISGKVYNSTAETGNEAAGAWVWAGKPSTGYYNGVQSSSDGSYSIRVPYGTGYNLGVEKPGYISTQPSELAATGTIVRNLILTPHTYMVSGRIYKDLDSDNTYDSGEEVPGGFIRAETTDNLKRSYATADGSGRYEIGVVNGTWKIYANSNGFNEAQFSSNIVISGGNAVANIKLTSNTSWVGKVTSKPIVPASGGVIDDTSASGTGIKITIPPNALGNSSYSGNISAQLTTSVAKTNSNIPAGNQGVSITAADNSGQSINYLNDYADIEMVIYKAEVDSNIASGTYTYEYLKNTKNGYWDDALNDWVNLSTVRSAYYKTDLSDSDWLLYSNNATTTDQFEAFINEVASGSLVPADYKLVYSSKTNHFTVFAVIMPFAVIRAQAETPPPSSPPSGGGGGSVAVQYCSSVTYDDWGSVCSADGLETRGVLSSLPTGCVLTNEQKAAMSRECEVLIEEPKNQDENVVILSENEEKALNERAKQWQQIIDDSLAIYEGKVANTIANTGVKRNLQTEANALSKYVKNLLSGYKGATNEMTNALTNFIAYGTVTTKWLGAGERAGVVNSFKSAFGKLPSVYSEWRDNIAIANGRWPNQKSETAESAAIKSFAKIYKRQPNRQNANDDAAVTIIAYGLRPDKRNLSSESNATRIFKAIYGKNPSSATDWDIVRAIAYSGAKR